MSALFDVLCRTDKGWSERRIEKCVSVYTMQLSIYKIIWCFIWYPKY
jgi:hypothetical protein